MGLIKSPNIPGGARTFSLRDVEDQVRSALQEARRRAEDLLADAERQAEELRRLAYEQGLAEGRAEGITAGTQQGLGAGAEQALALHGGELARVVDALAGAMRELDASRRDLETRAVREVVALAAAIARRVTKRQGLIDPGVLAANIAEAMKLVVHARDVRIAFHPSQRAAIEAVMPQLRLGWPDTQHVSIVEDPTLSPGGCRVYAGNGVIDADLDEQLDRVIADLLPDRGRTPGAGGADRGGGGAGGAAFDGEGVA